MINIDNVVALPARLRWAVSSSNIASPGNIANERPDFSGLAWSLTALPEGVRLLAQQAGLTPRSLTAAAPSTLPAPTTHDEGSLTDWLTHATQPLGCDVQAVAWHFGDITQLVRRAAPAILHIPQPTTTRVATDDAAAPGFLLLLKGGRRRVLLLAPNHKAVWISAAKLTLFLQAQTSGNLGQSVEQLLRRTGVAEARIPSAQAALVAEQMSAQRFHGCWLLKVATQRPLWQHLRHNRLPRYLLLLVALSILQQALTLISWRYIGQNVFQNELSQHRFSNAGLTAWMLILLTGIPLSLWANWAQINITLNLSRLARSRLLQGILNLNPSTIRHLGAGQFLERVMQTESFKTLLLGGGFGVINALLQLGAAAIILRLGVGGNLHSVLLLFWLCLTLGLSLWVARRFVQWHDAYRALTNDLVERMVAHRTRLAQEDKRTWHLAEDEQLDHYHTLTRRLDNLERLLSALLNRGWFLVGLAGIALPFINGADDPIPLAISIAGILLASSAFAALRSAIVTLADIFATWRAIGPLFQAANQPPSLGATRYTPPASSNQSVEQPAKPLLVAHNLQFRYHAQAPLTLNQVDLTIYPGDRLLLEGPSGGGKSTLSSLLVGLQQPTSGVLLLHGLDQSTLGLTHWRQRVVSAPQFHENHVLTESFGFNLLMGRRWPATPADLLAAEQICRELGLGDLLERMPGGMMQMVGESGWQLSHGERSRLFIARTLLQETDLVVLDESFAALDPETLERAITCVLKRAPTLLVIAHP